MPSSDHPGYRQATAADQARAAGGAQVLDNHRVVRDGSVWACRRCLATWPFPGRMPDAPGPCTPRRWGDQ